MSYNTSEINNVAQWEDRDLSLFLRKLQQSSAWQKTTYFSEKLFVKELSPEEFAKCMTFETSVDKVWRNYSRLTFSADDSVLRIFKPLGGSSQNTEPTKFEIFNNCKLFEKKKLFSSHHCFLGRPEADELIEFLKKYYSSNLKEEVFTSQHPFIEGSTQKSFLSKENEADLFLVFDSVMENFKITSEVCEQFAEFQKKVFARFPYEKIFPVNDIEYFFADADRLKLRKRNLESSFDLEKLKIDCCVEDLYAAASQVIRAGRGIQSHPLGFHRLPVSAANRREEGLYLHFWEKSSHRMQDERIYAHCHIFDLESRIISGGVNNIIYSIEESSNGDTSKVDVVYDTNEDWHIVEVSKVFTNLEATFFMGKDDIYEMKRQIFHVTQIRSNTAMTLMQKTNLDLRLCPYGLTKQKFEPEKKYEKYRLSETESLRMLDKAFNTI